MKKNWCLWAVIWLTATSVAQTNTRFNKNRIQPWEKNPFYWQYKGKPVMLLGASDDDNLFQWPKEMLIPHLDLMKRIGANYVRNTMSDRNDRNIELYPFKQLENGKYDLNQWNEAYWERFDFFLKETAKRNIIVQIEVWDRFDFSQKYWTSHPYNPRNNINYTRKNSGLAEEYPEHAGTNRQPFFFTTTKQRNNEILLAYQQKFVEKLMEHSLKYNHVLYCIDNETSGEEEWASYWSAFMADKAEAKGKKIYITEMWDNWNLKSEHHKRTFDHPERYSFCDVSQNNHQTGDKHWDNFQWVRRYISTNPRPINAVKTYGADGGRFGTSEDGIQRWWLHLLGGAAAVRFHRPDSGLGLSKLSISSIRAARKLESVVKPWNLQPNNGMLPDRIENEAYLTYFKDEIFVIFFPNGGSTVLELKDNLHTGNINFLDLLSGEWLLHKPEDLALENRTLISTPDNGPWVAVIQNH